MAVEAEPAGGQQHKGAALADQQQGGEAVGAEQHHAVDLGTQVWLLAAWWAPTAVGKDWSAWSSTMRWPAAS